MRCLFDKEKMALGSKTDNGEADEEEDADAPAKKKTMPWQRNFKKGKKSAGSKKPGNKKGKSGEKKTAEADKSTKDDEKVKADQQQTKSKEDNSDVSGSEEEDDEEEEVVSKEEEEEAEKSANNDSSEPEKDDDDLVKLQSDVALRRQRLLEGKSQISHSVHCPYFPADKQEYWWVYISDRKQQVLLTAPYHVTNLVEHEEIQLKFTAPFKPGFYTFAVSLRSDSYMGFDQMKDIKVIRSGSCIFNDWNSFVDTRISKSKTVSIYGNMFNCFADGRQRSRPSTDGASAMGNIGRRRGGEELCRIRV